MLRRSVFAVLLALTIAAPAAAQEAISTRFYIVPKVGTGVFPDFIRPKYVLELSRIAGQPRVQFTAMDYGLEDTFLVAANVTPTQHASFSGNIDVIALPADIDSPIALTALATVKTRLDGVFVPADDLTTATTYRQAIRAVGEVFLVMQRYHGIYGERFFQNGGDLDVQLRTLTGHRAGLIAAAQDLAATYSVQLDTSAIKGTTTVRQALHIVVAQLPGFQLGANVF